MSERVVQLLRSLRDLEGVVGGFVWSKTGALLGRDLPAHLDDGALAGVGQRIQRVYETFQGAGDELDTATLVFEGHRLHLREVDAAFIAVLAQSRVNEHALKMALHVVGRSLYEELERRAPAATPAPPAARTPQPTHALRLRLQRVRRPAD